MSEPNRYPFFGEMAVDGGLGTLSGTWQLSGNCGGTGVEPLEARLGEVLVERGNGRSGHRWSRQWMRITWQLVKDVISRMA